MKKSNNQEIDILVLFNGIYSVIISGLLFIYRILKGVVLRWKQLLALLVAGVLLAYITPNKSISITKEANILVKINFDAGNYVYDAIELINLKLNSGEESFFKDQLNLSDEEIIGEISIKPIIDIKDIANKRIEPSEMTALFENLEYEDSFLITEGFRSDYDYHLINISLSSSSTNNTIKKIIQYFNSNPLFISLKERNSNRISQIILDNEKSINQIDQILTQYMTRQSTNSSQLYIDNKEINANDLIKTKIGLQQKNEELKYENLTTTNTVIAVNESNVLFENESFFANKLIYYPFVLIFIYLISISLFGLYKYFEKLDSKV